MKPINILRLKDKIKTNQTLVFDEESTFYAALDKMLKDGVSILVIKPLEELLTYRILRDSSKSLFKKPIKFIKLIKFNNRYLD